MTDAGLVHLKGMVSLQMLDLDGTQITDAGLVQMKGLRKALLPQRKAQVRSDFPPQYEDAGNSRNSPIRTDMNIGTPNESMRMNAMKKRMGGKG